MNRHLHFLFTSFFYLTFVSFRGLAAETKKESIADKPAPSAAPTGQPQYILKDVKISFEDDDEAVPVLHLPKETKIKKSTAAKKAQKKVKSSH